MASGQERLAVPARGHVPLDPSKLPAAYQTLLDSMPEAVSLSRGDGIVLYANSTADRLFG
jgi:PAS domain-containing protein